MKPCRGGLRAHVTVRFVAHGVACLLTLSAVDGALEVFTTRTMRNYDVSIRDRFVTARHFRCDSSQSD